ncbi:selenocysteine-specific translation elongation factor [Halomonas piscis]|uniref:Selenocysteine-specific translation elongation factor n=1 Tax=Halomonas piscis TaxID=3031727 RepID=A0ABY9YY60_9GAMM|nr:selenocysteine-specific translation elongation factor [Halomonas piscis]WNK19814.1 selenocysteine-specific translation elongation factor [Halomonas piscis]
MIVATAGHIDHGKTALLAALTGAGGDHRREERERGMTIDLGYRYAALDAATTLGFIDVPGHEKFVHNMLAGAGGVDIALLVVAADDGVMPQTREHLAILGLLGIPRLWIVLTKTDRVDADRCETVETDVRRLLAASGYQDAPCFALSSHTGEGVDALREALARQAREVAARSDEGEFRLSVDRSFSVAGAGVVVTGTALAGRLSVGDSLWSEGEDGRARRLRVRGLHAQNRPGETATAGQRVALNLAGERLRPEHVPRGSWLVGEALRGSSRRLDVQLRVLEDAPRALSHWTPVHVHLGAQRLMGRVALLAGKALAPGEEGPAQLVLEGQVHAVHGDAVVLRDQSAWFTLGGGCVLDPQAPARGRRTPARLAELELLASGGLETTLTTRLETAHNGLAPDALVRQYNRPGALRQLPDGVRSVTTRRGERLFAEARWRALGQALTAALAAFHEQQPDEPGPDRARLRRFALAYLEPAVYTALVDEALAAGAIHASGPWLHLPDHRIRLSAEEDALKARLWPLLEAGGMDPPWVRDLARRENIDEARVRALLRKLSRMGQLHQVVRDLFYPAAAVEALAAEAMTLADSDTGLSVVAFRDRLGLGRKRCVQLLEYLDHVGVTRRFGNRRRIREESSMAQRLRTR